MELKIEQGVPMPKGKEGGATRALQAMTVGDSFLYPKVKRQSLATMFYRLSGMKFATRSVDADTIRVWRIK